ncbi:MAG: hypothetical protein ACU836_01630 [Gammaproteobacteria bacterium]
MISKIQHSLKAIAIFFGLALFTSFPSRAAFVDTSSDMMISNLRVTASDPNAQLQWTDNWFGQVVAHAADSDSLPADDFNSLLGNDDSIQAVASTAHVRSLATDNVKNGGQIAIDPVAEVSGNTHSDLHLEHSSMQADGFAVSNFDNFFMLVDSSDPNNLGPIQVLIQMDFGGSLFGNADAEGMFVDITHIASLSLFDIVTNGLLGSDSFQDSISGVDTTLTHNNSGVLEIPLILNYNTQYWLSAEADSEIYGSTVPEPNTLLLLFICVPAVFRFSRKQIAN